ncbi:hypothetical protein GSI_11080 [Ganoderma sinense ZZ0214-1]|uniref:Transporter n=1 Tax=Ganoderma sinense ZZ0214-1 TaxID=1077348 RepID=A0A2G8RZ70_9APHY|nr:hypothetical protein GSI_11080 [Ganoderma sinense ZZ0214-1]
MLAAAPLLVLAGLSTGVLGTSYFLTDNIRGSQFLSAFTHQAIPDPTHGRVNYVSQATALERNLTYASGDTLILRADSTQVLDPFGPGRDSFRLQSNKVYNEHVAVWNIRHMPQGCGTTNGNDCYTNSSTFGCGVIAPRATSFGPSFNAIGGGWYAMERSGTYIKIWHWQRDDTNLPMDIRIGSPLIDTSNWGTPVADFPDTDCNMATYFSPQRMIINLTFCGDLAGHNYPSDGCSGICEGEYIIGDYVNQNPSAFEDAYFDIAWLKIYQ